MENLTITQQGTLMDSKKEFLDLIKTLDIEIANTDNIIAKASMLETKFKTLTAIVNLDKQRKNIYPLQRI
jgi:hypothetical protein